MTSKERAALRAKANGLEPIIQLGKEGISENLLTQIDDTLDTRELIKIRVHLESAPETPKELADNLEAAGKIVKEQMEEFFQWLDGRDIIPRIQEIKADAVEDLNLRIEKIFRKTPMEDSDREKLKKAVDTAAGKVVNKLIFGLRDSLNQDVFLECVEGLEKLYEE